MKTKLVMLSCVLLCACGGSENQNLPEGVLTDTKMVEVLIDVYYGQAKVNDTRLYQDSSARLYQYYQRHILEKRGVDSATFINSLNYYFDHPEVFYKINEVVLDSLNFKLHKLEAQEEKDSKKRKKD